METIILELLQKLHPATDISSDARLFDDGVLDSMDIVLLVTSLNQTFDIRIPATEILPDNFNSVRDIAHMIERLTDI